MKRRAILLLAAMGATLIVASGVAWATHYGDPANYTLSADPDSSWYPRPHSDKNGDRIIVFRHDTNAGTKSRDAWNTAKAELNQWYVDHGNQGVRLIRNTDTNLAVELSLDRITTCPNDGRGGWYYQVSNGPDVATLCQTLTNADAQKAFNVTARHELFHAEGAGHRPCNQNNVSVMSATGGCPVGTYTFGDADLETWEYLWIP